MHDPMAHADEPLILELVPQEQPEVLHRAIVAELRALAP